MCTSGSSPLLAPDFYEPGRNIRDWLRRALDAGLSPATPFPIACRCVIQLFDTPDAPGIAAERFATLHQDPRQSVDDFATELTRLASAAFPNLPHPDRDDLILHRFISGLLDRTITDSFLLHPPRTLNDALRQCRLYLTYHRAHQPPPRPPARPAPQAQIDGTLCRSASPIITLAASTAQLFDPELATVATTHRRLMYRVLQPLIPDKCLIYLDDIIVFGRSIDEHNHDLRAVLEALRSAGLTLNSTKCLFYVAREKNRPFVWSDDCACAFTDLCAALCLAPLLSLPNIDKDAPPFILDIDANGYAIGAVLSQADANGVEHPICFASNTLTKPQRNYCTFRRELPAIVESLRQSKHLLIGQRFILRTDHRALQWLRSFKDPMDQLARWRSPYGTSTLNACTDQATSKAMQTPFLAYPI
nr:unnamed protein product [Spirometra erinaceieuropaei]